MCCTDASSRQEEAERSLKGDRGIPVSVSLFGLGQLPFGNVPFVYVAIKGKGMAVWTTPLRGGAPL